MRTMTALILVLVAALGCGSKEANDGDSGAALEADADADADAVGHDAVHVHPGHATADQDMGLGSFVALFLSVRFWVFAALGFGLSGRPLQPALSGFPPGATLRPWVCFPSTEEQAQISFV